MVMVIRMRDNLIGCSCCGVCHYPSPLAVPLLCTTPSCLLWLVWMCVPSIFELCVLSSCKPCVSLVLTISSFGLLFLSVSNSLLTWTFWSTCFTVAEETINTTIGDHLVNLSAKLCPPKHYRFHQSSKLLCPSHTTQLNWTTFEYSLSARGRMLSLLISQDIVLCLKIDSNYWLGTSMTSCSSCSMTTVVVVAL